MYFIFKKFKRHVYIHYYISILIFIFKIHRNLSNNKLTGEIPDSISWLAKETPMCVFIVLIIHCT